MAQTPPAIDPATKPSWTKGSDELPAFPKPEPEKFLSELKMSPKKGDRYYVAQEDWDGARGRVANEPAWKEWLAKRRESVDRWMAKHHDRPGWKAGWHHDFVSPKDSSFLTWTEAIPGEEAKTFTDKSGASVEITPKLFDAWVYRFRGKHMEQMIEAGRLYRLTGDVRYAEWAAGQLDFYATNLAQWPITKAKGNYARLGCQSLDDAGMLTKLTETARLLFDWAGAERRQIWFDQLFKPEVELLDRSFQTIHNIATWHRSAQAGVALLYQDEAMWQRVVDGKFGLRAQIRQGVTSDYFWYEQSMGYNSFVVMATLPLFELADLLGQKERLREESEIIQNMMLAPLTIRFPDGSLPNPADQTGLPRVPYSLLQQASRVWPTSIGLKQAQAAKTWDILVDTRPLVLENYELPKVVSRHMESSRFAQLVSGPWQVFFHYGQLARSHSQDEALNWSASCHGIDITHDAGTVGYGSPMANGYYRRGLTHNVPLVNGEGEDSWHRGTMLRFDPEAALMSAEQPQYRPDATARRTLRIEGDTLIDEATISSTRDASKLGLALHLHGQPKLGEEFKPVANFAENRPEAFKYWKEVRSATFKDRAEIEVTFPKNLVLRVEFSVPGEFTLYTGSSPDQPPARRTGFYLELPGREATFVTRFTPVGSRK